METVILTAVIFFGVAILIALGHVIQNQGELLQHAREGYKIRGPYFIGQRVLVGNEIGTIVTPEHNNSPRGNVWVYLPSWGRAAHFVPHNVDPLPNGQV